MSPASSGDARAKGPGQASKAGPAKPVAAPAPEPTEGTGLSSAEPPELPPFWLEKARVIAEKWPLPVFFVAVVAAGVVFLARPKAEKELPWNEYVQRAQGKFKEAVQAQDERGDLPDAIRRIGSTRSGDDAGVLYNYEMALGAGGRGKLRAADYACIGESYFRLARIKRDYGDQDGRIIVGAPRDLFARAARYLAQARRMAQAEDSEAVRKGQPRGHDDLDTPEWRSRWLMLAECLVQIGDERNALEELNRLVETMSAAQAGRLSREKSVYEKGSSASGDSSSVPAGGVGGEWARVYDLLARCHDRRAEKAEKKDVEKAEKKDAARYFRLALEQGASGLPAHRARLRLAELVIASAIDDEENLGRGDARDEGDRQAKPESLARAASGFEEVCRLCSMVERSDAPADLREDATFLEGRAAYRLGGVTADPDKARAAYERAARAFRYAYSPGKPYLDLSRVLLARSLFLAGNREDAQEMLDTLLRIGAAPAVYSCAEVTRADMFVETDPAKALGSRVTTPQSRVLHLSTGEELLLARLGLRVAGVTRNEAARFGEGVQPGAPLVAFVVAGGPSEKAGISKGDLVVAVGGQGIAGASGLFSAAAALKPGVAVEVGLVRPVPDGRAPAVRKDLRLVPAVGDPVSDLLGLTAVGIGAEEADAAGLSRPGACLVTSVVAGGPADRAEVRKGDLLTGIGGRDEIFGLGDLQRAAAALKPGAEVELALARPESGVSVSFGYIDAARRIRRLTPDEHNRLAEAPELAALLADEHFVLPDLRGKGRLFAGARAELPPGGAQLLRIARSFTAAHEYDEAARIYRHILETYPRVARDQYHYLLGELYAEKAAWQVRGVAPDQRQLRLARMSRLAAAREFMCVPGPQGAQPSPLTASAYWWAGKCYFDARRYGGACHALGIFCGIRQDFRKLGGFIDDPRISEALYLYGESLRRLGDLEGAAKAFARCALDHGGDRFGYLAQLALGETYLEMGRLDASPEEKGDRLKARQNARAIFESIRRDSRYTPESEVWMKALFRLGQTYYLMGRSCMDRVKDAALEGRPDVAVAEDRAGAQVNFQRAIDILEEFRERYPPARYGPEARPSFHEFLRRERLPLLHMLALSYMDREQGDQSTDQALQLFGDILQVSSEPAAFADREDSDRYRRLAFGYKGLLEIQKGRAAADKGLAAEKTRSLEAAFRTFQQAHDEFVRTEDAPLFSSGMAQAREFDGQAEEARRLYEQAHAELLKQKEENGRAGAPAVADVLDQKWVLPPEDWARRVSWARDTL